MFQYFSKRDVEKRKKFFGTLLKRYFKHENISNNNKFLFIDSISKCIFISASNRLIEKKYMMNIEITVNIGEKSYKKFKIPCS